MIDLYLVQTTGFDGDAWKRVREICLSHGGQYFSPAPSRKGPGLPTGYVFRSREQAEAAEREIKAS